MLHRSSNEDLRDHINDRLAAYHKQSNEVLLRSRSSTLKRTFQMGSLAAMAHLAGAVGDAKAQVGCYQAFGTVTLTEINDVAIFAHGPLQSMILELLNSSPSTAVRIASFDSTSPGLFHVNGSSVRRLDSSNSFSGTSASLQNFALLCNTAGFGPFCPGDGPGFIPIQIGTGVGLLELEVRSKSGGAAEVYVGRIDYSGPTPSSLHAGDCVTVLPVELVSFDVLVDDGSNLLTWETASELNNAGFEIQRSTANQPFRKIAFVDGRGTTLDPQYYRYEDESAVPNTHYRYRLKQIDLDGTTSFSDIVEVFTERPGEVAIGEFYPNPSKHHRSALDINVADRTDARIEIFDAQGRRVDTRTTSLNAGANQVTFETGEFASGAHFAKLEVGNRILYRQFVVNR